MFGICLAREVGSLDKDIPEYNKVMKLFGLVGKEKVLTRVGERDYMKTKDGNLIPKKCLKD